jgi:hypothetical protein
VAISFATHGEAAALGEQTTIRLADSAKAARTFSLRSPAAGSSSRSRKIGVSRAGTGPSSPSLPARRRGSR